MSALGVLPQRYGVRFNLVPAAVLAGAFGYLAARHSLVGLALAAIPVGLWLLVNPAIAAAAAVSLVPIFHGQVTATDGLIVATTAALAARALVDPQWRAQVRYVRPVLLWALPFTLWLVVLVAVHYSPHVALNTAQDFELTVLPLVIGATAFTSRTARLAMQGYVAAACVLAALWLAGNTFLVGDKNPVGQFVANGAIVALVVFRRLWLRAALFAFLLAGLLDSQSRGAVIGIVAGLVVLALLGGLGNLRRAVAGGAVLAGLVVLIYQFSPADVQQRLHEITHSTTPPSETGLAPGYLGPLAGTSAVDTDTRIRDVYRQNGWALVKDHPIDGVGPGNYATGNSQEGTYTSDPHDIIIRTAGDGGIPELVTFGLMVVGTSVLALRRVRITRYAAVACAVQAAILVHSVADVYWVRGTPVLGWFLIGIAVNRQVSDHRKPSSPPAVASISTDPASAPAPVPVLAIA